MFSTDMIFVLPIYRFMHTNISLRLKSLCDAVFALPWSFGGKSRMDKAWGKLVYARRLIDDYNKIGG